MNTKRLSLNELEAARQEIEKENKAQERKSRIAKLSSVLMPLAITAKRAHGALVWNNKNNATDDAKKTELMKKVKEATEAFVKAYRQIVGNDLGYWWWAELQKEYVKDASSEALLTHYLSDSPYKKNIRDLVDSLKKAADEYIHGWELLGKKDRKALHGPIERVGNGDLAVEVLIEQLKAGDNIREIQAQILEEHFEDPIANLGKPAQATVLVPEEQTLGGTLGEKIQVPDEKESRKGKSGKTGKKSTRKNSGQ